MTSRSEPRRGSDDEQKDATWHPESTKVVKNTPPKHKREKESDDGSASAEPAPKLKKVEAKSKPVKAEAKPKPVKVEKPKAPSTRTAPIEQLRKDGVMRAWDSIFAWIRAVFPTPEFPNGVLYSNLAQMLIAYPPALEAFVLVGDLHGTGDSLYKQVINTLKNLKNRNKGEYSEDAAEVAASAAEGGRLIFRTSNKDRMRGFCYLDEDPIPAGYVRLRLEHTAPYMARNMLQGRPAFDGAPVDGPKIFRGFALHGRYGDCEFLTKHLNEKVQQFIEGTIEVRSQVIALAGYGAAAPVAAPVEAAAPTGPAAAAPKAQAAGASSAAPRGKDSMPKLGGAVSMPKLGGASAAPKPSPPRRKLQDVDEDDFPSPFTKAQAAVPILGLAHLGRFDHIQALHPDSGGVYHIFPLTKFTDADDENLFSETYIIEGATAIVTDDNDPCKFFHMPKGFTIEARGEGFAKRYVLREEENHDVNLSGFTFDSSQEAEVQPGKVIGSDSFHRMDSTRTILQGSLEPGQAKFMQENYFTKPGWSVKEVEPAKYIVSFAAGFHTVNYTSLPEAIVYYRNIYRIRVPEEPESEENSQESSDGDPAPEVAAAVAEVAAAPAAAPRDATHGC